MVGPTLAAELASLAARGWAVDTAVTVLRAHGVRRPDLDDATSTRLQEWSLWLRVPFSAPDVDSTCDAINVLLESAASRPSLSTHDGHKPALPDPECVAGMLR
ncbi:hypothetical protein C8N39_104140 [Dietzia psychralcaliphila]|nr:hypothetical protein C8N39_104140 [Dietzia psychralcaliphila]